MNLNWHVYWPCVRDDFLIDNCSVVYNIPNPVSDFNWVITSLIDRSVSSKVVRLIVNDKPWLDEDCVNAFRNKQNIIVSCHRIDYTFCGRSI